MGLYQPLSTPQHEAVVQRWSVAFDQLHQFVANAPGLIRPEWSGVMRAMQMIADAHDIAVRAIRSSNVCPCQVSSDEEARDCMDLPAHRDELIGDGAAWQCSMCDRVVVKVPGSVVVEDGAIDPFYQGTQWGVAEIDALADEISAFTPNRVLQLGSAAAEISGFDLSQDYEWSDGLPI